MRKDDKIRALEAEVADLRAKLAGLAQGGDTGPTENLGTRGPVAPPTSDPNSPASTWQLDDVTERRWRVLKARRPHMTLQDVLRGGLAVALYEIGERVK